MLNKIGNVLGLITALLSLSLLFLLAVYESVILENVIFISLAILFDLLLFVSHILLLIVSIKSKRTGTIIAFGVSILTFTVGMVVITIQGKDPRFLLCLYNALIVVFYGFYFYFDVRSSSSDSDRK